jgi:hypothetical protein
MPAKALSCAVVGLESTLVEAEVEAIAVRL